MQFRRGVTHVAGQFCYRCTRSVPALEALRWLRDIGCAFLHLDADARLLSVGTAEPLADARVRRGQALAPWTSNGLVIARALLTPKVAGQAALLDRMPGQGRAAAALREIATTMEATPTVEGIRYLESRAAVIYWDAWSALPVRFATREVETVPAHWLTVGARSSVLTDSPRKAVTPAHALLNYCYALLEAETRIAVLAVGLDPILGIVHTDHRARRSLVYDLMEPARPDVDAYVLHRLERRTFLKADVFETREGACRLMPALAEPLATTTLHWAKVIAPVAERIAGLCASAMEGPELTKAPGSHSANAQRYRTPLTHRNASRPLRAPKLTAVQERAALHALGPARCRECGATLTNPKRACCDICLVEQPRRASARARELGAMRMAAGDPDGRSSAAARQKHRECSAQAAATRKAWRAAHPVTPNPQQFTNEIWPLIRELPVDELVRASGLSDKMCVQIRRGARTPHPMHWDAFRSLIRGKRKNSTLGTRV